MPRSWTLRVQPLPELIGSFYLVRTTSVEKRDAQSFTVDLTHVLPEQEGRTHRVQLSTAVRPGTLTAQFFSACGFSIEVGAAIHPKKALGVAFLARFERDPDTGDYRVIEFKSQEQEELPC